ncbi:transcriptional regulator with XRE-family HTH domain [Microbacterium proteolyticum]|uniref:Transcriptional regulator with XRE-family HTH domain n=1 Tax=Microbacterium proteolyticum TaxID=1572644 RepID=A0A7W5GHC3_9MICO|nr:helix-turn-helix transcriptional regulator [Microbacterium proteolyticum]MBB3159132.1 transcriptional regulator with XRE-family HTH domain [Microbacterium proteolyticum]
MSDLAGLGDFLQRRREALQPEDVGLARGVRRRTAGLRREEVALLSHMSTDYYARLERGTGPTPSEQMLTSLAQGLHLSLAERDHLFRLAGHEAPSRHSATEHVSPGMLRVLDRLDDTPAEIVTELGETLRQSRLGTALLGDATLRRGPARSIGYRWFTDPTARAAYPPEEVAVLSRVYAAGLRELVAARGSRSRAAELSDDLRRRSEEFAALWDAHEVGARPPEVKRFLHPEVGHLDLSCQTLLDPDHSHRLLVYTAQPGSESAEKLRLLAVVGTASPAPH